MARRKTHRRKSSYTRLVGYTKKKEALKDAAYERMRGKSVKIKKERKTVFGRRRTVYGLYTKD